MLGVFRWSKEMKTEQEIRDKIKQFKNTYTKTYESWLRSGYNLEHASFQNGAIIFGEWVLGERDELE